MLAAPFYVLFNTHTNKNKQQPTTASKQKKNRRRKRPHLAECCCCWPQNFEERGATTCAHCAHRTQISLYYFRWFDSYAARAPTICYCLSKLIRSTRSLLSRLAAKIDRTASNAKRIMCKNKYKLNGSLCETN